MKGGGKVDNLCEHPEEHRKGTNHNYAKSALEGQISR